MTRTATATRTVVAALGALALLGVSACGSDDATSSAGASEGGVQLVQDGMLTTCTHLPYAPFESTEGDEVVGFDIDVADEIAADLGVEQQTVNIPFETIQSGEALNSGQCDIAAAGMTITDVREENMDFSSPYFDATQALLVPADSDITGADDLAGRRLAVQTGTTGEIYASENISDATPVQFEDLGLLLSAVQTGSVDAGINDNGVLFDFVADNPDVKVVTEFDTGEQYGIGVRTDNTSLLDQVNSTLERIDGDGTYDQIYTEWFGEAPEDSTSSPSTSPTPSAAAS